MSEISPEALALNLERVEINISASGKGSFFSVDILPFSGCVSSFSNFGSTVRGIVTVTSEHPYLFQTLSQVFPVTW